MTKREEDSWQGGGYPSSEIKIHSDGYLRGMHDYWLIRLIISSAQKFPSLLGIWFLIIYIFSIHSLCMWLYCFLQFFWICSFRVFSISSKNVSKFDVSTDEHWQFRYICMWLIEKTDCKIEVTSSPTNLHPVSFHRLRQQIDADLRERSKSQVSDLSWGVCEIQRVSLTLS